MAFQLRSRPKAVTIITAIFTLLSVVLLLIGFITYIWDIHEALRSCWSEIMDNLPKHCGLRGKYEKEKCEEVYLYYEPSCYYYNEKLGMAVGFPLILGGVFAIVALICYCYSINLSTLAPTKRCNNRCLWKGWVSLATIGGLFAVYSLAFFLHFSHYPAAIRPPTEGDTISYVLYIAGGFAFLAVSALLVIIGLGLLFCMGNDKTQGAHEEEVISI